MKRKHFLALLCAPLLFTACKKSEQEKAVDNGLYVYGTSAKSMSITIRITRPGTNGATANLINRTVTDIVNPYEYTSQELQINDHVYIYMRVSGAVDINSKVTLFGKERGPGTSSFNNGGVTSKTWDFDIKNK